MRRVNGLACFLWLFCGWATLAFAHEDDAYSHSASDGFTDKSSWMKTLRGDVQLSELALPGTHDSATFDISLFPIVTDIVQTQVLSFDEQLKYGIRVFDLRIRRTADSFALHHGQVFLDKMFGSALGSIHRFLEDNPSETVLFRIKEEYSADADATLSMAQVFDEYLNRYSGTYLRTQNTKVTLGEARGRFVVLSNIASLNRYGLSYARFDIQDDSTLSTNWGLHDKYMKVKKQLRRASSGSRDTFYVNYLSGSVGSFPYFVASGHVTSGTAAPRLSTGLIAFGDSDWYPSFPRTTCLLRMCTISFEGTNTLARDDIETFNEQIPSIRTVGIVMADFPGESLISNIIGNNYRAEHDLGR